MLKRALFATLASRAAAAQLRCATTLTRDQIRADTLLRMRSRITAVRKTTATMLRMPTLVRSHPSLLNSDELRDARWNVTDLAAAVNDMECWAALSSEPPPAGVLPSEIFAEGQAAGLGPAELEYSLLLYRRHEQLQLEIDQYDKEVKRLEARHDLAALTVRPSLRVLQLFGSLNHLALLTAFRNHLE